MATRAAESAATVNAAPASLVAMASVITSVTSMGGPVYREIARSIMQRLELGAWKPGEAIPSETRLKEEFGVAIGTIRKAVDELVAQGILLRQQGRGTFVATHNRDRQLFRFFHIERQDGYKEYPDVQLTGFERIQLSREVADKLTLHEGDRAVRLRNTLSLEGKAVMIEDITLPESLFPRMTEKKLRERPNTLYKLYQDDYRISVVRTAQRLSAGVAPRDVARTLDLPAGLPVLVIRASLSQTTPRTLCTASSTNSFGVLTCDRSSTSRGRCHSRS